MSNESIHSFEIDFTYKDKSPNKQSLHTHQRYEVFYFHSGACTFFIGGQLFNLQPGDLLLLNGKTLHCPKIEHDQGYVRSVIHFEKEGVQPFLKAFHSLDILKPFNDYKHYRLRLEGETKLEIERILETMSKYDQEDKIAYNRFKLLFVDLLYFLLEQFNKSEVNQDEGRFTTPKERIVLEIITFIEQNYQRDMRLDDLEAHLHLNKAYLSKLFKKLTGTTIMSYLNEYRIKQSKLMFVENKKVPVTEVCYEVGFKHLSHFSRLFKQNVGQTPEAFKKLYGQ